MAETAALLTIQQYDPDFGSPAKPRAEADATSRTGKSNHDRRKHLQRMRPFSTVRLGICLPSPSGHGVGRSGEVRSMCSKTRSNAAALRSGGRRSGYDTYPIKPGGQSPGRTLEQRPLLEDPIDLLRSLPGCYVRSPDGRPSLNGRIRPSVPVRRSALTIFAQYGYHLAFDLHINGRAVDGRHRAVSRLQPHPVPSW